jgi:hypothetical protein
VGALVGLGGVWSWWFVRNLRARPLLPVAADELGKEPGHE